MDAPPESLQTSGDRAEWAPTTTFRARRGRGNLQSGADVPPDRLQCARKDGLVEVNPVSGRLFYRERNQRVRFLTTGPPA